MNNVQTDVDRNDIITTEEDLVGRESVQSYSNVVPPPSTSKKEPSLINVYSFTNKHGQKEKVGIIYDQASLRSPQVNNIFDSQKKQIDYVDWIELIKSRETRNYVQRVLENYNVYRYVLEQKPIPMKDFFKNNPLF